MSTPRAETTGEPDDKQRATFDAADETLTKSLLRRVRDGSLPLLAGVALFAGAVRARRRGGDARGLALAATALLTLGLRQRRTSVSLPDAAGVGRRDETTGKDVSDEAHAATVRNDTGRRPEAEAEGDVHPTPAVGADEAGERVVYTDDPDGEARSKPAVDGPNDPRRTRGGEPEEVDSSASAVADEPGEATGPEAAQSQPAQTEDTEPEDSPEADASHTRADVPDGETPVDRGDDETGSPEGEEEETADAAEADDESGTDREW